MSMTPEQIAAERERFEKFVCDRTFLNVGRNEHAQYESDQTNHAWAGYRWRADIAHAEQAELQGAIAAQTERQRKAGERCGVPYEQHGCDWPEWVADRVLEQQAKIDRLRERVRLHAKEKLKEWRAENSEYSSEWLWEWAGEDELWVIELAHEAGVWFDDEGNEVPLETWKGMVGT